MDAVILTPEDMRALLQLVEKEMQTTDVLKPLYDKLLDICMLTDEEPCSFCGGRGEYPACPKCKGELNEN